jgi:sortase A
MRKKLGITFISIGTALLIAALSLLIYNNIQSENAKSKANEILEGIEKIQEANEKATQETSDGDKEDSSQEETEPTIVYDGITYLGSISIPVLDIEIPLTADYQESYMDFAACRYAGKRSENNLVICAHNYRTYFGKIGSLQTDDVIVFKAADGEIYQYKVTEIITINGYAVDAMLSDSENWDLTLFTCDYAGTSRVTIRAVSIDSD